MQPINQSKSSMIGNTIRQKFGLRHEPIFVQDRAAAFDIAAHCMKPHRIILGDDERFWVVCPADAAKLSKMGYEYAN